MTEKTFAVMCAAKARVEDADRAFERALVAEYGPARARDARYTNAIHTPAIAAAREAYQLAAKAWFEGFK